MAMVGSTTATSADGFGQAADVDGGMSLAGLERLQAGARTAQVVGDVSAEIARAASQFAHRRSLVVGAGDTITHGMDSCE